MKSTSIKITALLCASAMLPMGWAADPETPPATAANTPDVAKLTEQLDQQQKMIERLVGELAAQRKLLEQLGAPAAAVAATPHPASDGLVASTVPVLPVPAVAPVVPFPPVPQATAAAAEAPLQLKIGSVGIQPIGFMDLTSSWKDKDAGGSLGTNFGSIPYNNTPAAKLSEFRFSPQNSRIGFRIDGDWKDAHFIAYNEFDFLGTSGGNNLSVTNGAFVPRLRLFWVDVRKGKLEFLAGQSWSMLTPNRKGISALPGDLFYSQTIDVNYMVGLTWTRQPGVRILYHPNEKVTFGFSAENPDQYIGGSAGGSPITLPTALTGLAGTQLDNQTNVQNIPNLHPDFIAKFAFDPSARAHFEIAGIERTFKIWNITTGQPTSGQYFSKVAGGGSLNGNFELAKGFRVVTNNFYSSGGGRYLFGQAPDLIVRADGSISSIHSGGFVEGFEETYKKWLLYAYWGNIYIGRNTARDTNGSFIGYGYPGSPNSMNRSLNEVSFGFNETIWRDAKYGAINLMGQYFWEQRNPWYVAPNSPKATHLNTIFFNLRYTLPGSAPPQPEYK